MNLKHIHYTEKGKYLENNKFICSFDKDFKKANKSKIMWLGDLGDERIIVKKLTKKEKDHELKNYKFFLLKYLREKQIPFIEINKITKNKDMICKFMGAELWIEK